MFRKKFTKLFSLFLCLVFSITCLFPSTTVHAATTYSYTIFDDGVGTSIGTTTSYPNTIISSYFTLTTDPNTGLKWYYKVANGEATHVFLGALNQVDNITTLTIPSSLDGYPVTSVGSGVFYRESGGAVFTNGFNIFQRLVALDGTGSYDNKVKTIIVPDGVKKIEAYAFLGTQYVTSIVLPDTVESIGAYAFSNVPLTTINLPSGLKSIGSSAFYGNKFTSVTIDSRITYGASAFANMPTLKTVAFNGPVTTIPDYLFSKDTGITSITLPSTLLSIGATAFFQCTGLTRIDIPESVTSIGASAFSMCSNLTNIYFYSPNTAINSTVDTIPTNTIIHGLDSSTAKAWALTKGRVFELMAAAAPSVPIQTLSFDKYTPNNISVNVNLGISDLKATGVTDVKLSEVSLPSNAWSLVGSSVVIDKAVFSSLPTSSSNFITIVFNDFSETTLKNAKVNIVDTTPFKNPSVTTKNPVFDRLFASTIDWAFDYGTEGTSLEVLINSTPVDSNNYSIVSNKITLNQSYLNSLENGEYTITFKFNDSLNTEVNDTLNITGIIPISPVVDIQGVTYNKNDISYTIGFGNIATEIIQISINGNTLPTNYYNIEENTLTLSNDYLSSLSNGLYVIKLEYNDGTIIDNKLSFIIPKDTTTITPNNSLLNILYVNGSSANISIPLAGNPTAVTNFYMDSALVPLESYSFDSARSILTISNELLNSAGMGTHSIILELEYDGSFIVGTNTSGTITMPTMFAPGDIGIIVSSINGGTTGLTYHVDENGNTIIDGYLGNETEVTIPSDVNGSPVTGIEDLQDDSGNTNVDKVTIPETVSTINPGAVPPTTEIVATPGSAGETYANDNGNTYTPSTGSGNGSGSDGGSGSTPVAPTVGSQNKKFDKNNPSDITVNNINMGSATSVNYIIIGNYKIYKDGTIETINDIIQAKNVILINEAVLAPAAPFSGVPFTINENGELVINGDLLSQLDLETSPSYDIKVGFDDGTEVSNAIALEVVDTASTPPTDPEDNGGSNPPTDPPVDNGGNNPPTNPPVDNGGSNPPTNPPVDNGGNNPPTNPPVDNGGNNPPTNPPVDNGGNNPSTGNNSNTTTVRSIVSIEKTSSNGLVDTYTITYSDGTTSTFTVTNGKDGQNFNDLTIKDIEKTSTDNSNKTDTYTITYSDGTTSTITISKNDNEKTELDILKKIIEEIRLIDGVKEIKVEKGSNEGIVINVYINETIINNTYVYLNDKQLDSNQYKYDSNTGKLTINDSALNGLNNGNYAVDLGLKDANNKVIASREISTIIITNPVTNTEVAENIITINRTITLGTKADFNIINESKNAVIKYTSNNSKVCSINNSGTFSAKKLGKSVITITLLDKNIKTIYNVNINVVDKQGNKDILDTTRNVYLNGYIKLNTNAKNVKFTVANNKILKVASNGTVTPLKKGVSTVKVTETYNQLQLVYTAKLTVKTPYIKLTKSISTIKIGQSFDFNATSYDSTSDNISWYVLDSSVAKIDYNTGVIKGIKKGKTTIIVTCGKNIKSYDILVK